MKRRIIALCIVSLVTGMALSALAEREDTSRSEQGNRNLREAIARRWNSMSEEQRQKAQARARAAAVAYYYESGGFHCGPQERDKAFKAIEEHLTKLKAIPGPQFEGKFEDLPEEEQAEISKKMRESYRVQRQAFEVITQQLARLQGLHLGEAEEVQFLIVSTGQLKRIQDAAIKEKATQTSALIGWLIPGEGGRGPGRGNPPQDPQPNSTAAPPDRRR